MVKLWTGRVILQAGSFKMLKSCLHMMIDGGHIHEGLRIMHLLQASAQCARAENHDASFPSTLRFDALNPHLVKEPAHLPEQFEWSG